MRRKGGAHLVSIGGAIRTTDGARLIMRRKGGAHLMRIGGAIRTTGGAILIRKRIVM